MARRSGPARSGDRRPRGTQGFVLPRPPMNREKRRTARREGLALDDHAQYQDRQDRTPSLSKKQMDGIRESAAKVKQFLRDRDRNQVDKNVLPRQDRRRTFFTPKVEPTKNGSIAVADNFATFRNRKNRTRTA